MRVIRVFEINEGRNHSILYGSSPTSCNKFDPSSVQAAIASHLIFHFVPSNLAALKASKSDLFSLNLFYSKLSGKLSFSCL